MYMFNEKEMPQDDNRLGAMFIFAASFESGHVHLYKDNKNELYNKLILIR